MHYRIDELQEQCITGLIVTGAMHYRIDELQPTGAMHYRIDELQKQCITGLTSYRRNALQDR